jgi:Zn-dependent metalloprotease
MIPFLRFAPLALLLIALPAPASSPASTAALVDRIAVRAGVAPADLFVVSDRVDVYGLRHLRLQQQRHGLEVVDGLLIAHFDARGVFYRLDGPVQLRDVPATPTLPASLVPVAAQAEPALAALAAGPAQLVYVVSSRDDRLHLAWESLFTGARDGAPARDRVFVDAHDGRVVDVLPQVEMLRNRLTYDANHSISLPGTLKRSETTPPVADVDVNDAHDNAGVMYDCFHDLFGRDSLDDQGMTLRSVVHYSTNYANAFWDSTEMVYGDGDPSADILPLDRALDIGVHEMTHGVTEREAGLTYSGESGALNESVSDTAAATCESWSRGGVVDANTWTIAEDVIQPPLRWLDDPAKDGASKDYYSTSLGNADPHYGSGVPNLAFYLMSAGGHHPRGKSAIEVTGMGIVAAEEAWYRALTTYFTPTIKLAAARDALVRAAQDVHPRDLVAFYAVNDGLAAVGVGGVTPRPVALAKGVPVTGIASGDHYYTFDLPQGASQFTVSTTVPRATPTSTCSAASRRR